MAQPTMAAIPGLKDTYVQLKTRMDKAVDDFRKAMAAVRTGRASVHMLDGITVDAYGAQMPLNQVAQVHAPEAQLITVQPFDPSQLGAIEKAIHKHYTQLPSDGVGDALGGSAAGFPSNDWPLHP